MGHTMEETYLKAFLVVTLSYISFSLEFLEEPRDVVAALNKSLLWSCNAASVNDVTYSWRFEDSDLGFSPNSKIFQNGTLMIHRVLQSNAGVYMCIALSGRQSLYSRKAKLSLAYLSTFKVNPDSSTVQLGLPASLVCEILSAPPPIIVWIKNSSTVDSALTSMISTYTSKLTFKSVKYGDQGYYSCLASNSVLGKSTHSDSAFLSVNGKPVVALSPSNLTFPLMYTAVLHCIVTGNPPPVIDWLKINKTGSQHKIQESSRVAFFMNGTLVIRDTLENDAGIYTCLARNKFGEDSFSITISVTGVPSGPVFSLTPPDKVIAAVHSNLTLECKATGNPSPSISWQKEDRLLSSGSGDLALGKLSLWNISYDDSGVYVCFAVNTEGRISKKITLSLHRGPYFVVRPKSQDVVSGSRVVLECSVTANPTPTLHWITPSAGIISVQNRSVEGLRVLINGSLEISPAVAYHQGNYSCMAANNISSATVSAYITVEGEPMFTTRPVGRMVMEGDTVNFTCQASAFPFPIIRWFKDSQQYQLQNNEKYGIGETGQLIVRNVQKSDKGIYRCIAVNTFGQKEAVATLNLIQAPYIRATSSNITVGIGDKVLLGCVAEGDPVPVQKWEHEGHALKLDNNMFVFTNFSLLIENIQKNQFGIYTCVAANQGGISKSTFTIYSVGEPVILSVKEQRNSTTVSLSCEVSGLPEPKLSYITGSSIIGETTTGHFVVDQWLHISRNYLHDQYACQAENKYGTDLKTITKPEKGPKPQALKVEADAITVTWRSLHYSGNLLVLLTSLKYSDTNVDTSGVDLRVEVLPHTVTGLMPYTDYTFAVAFNNVLGSGIYGDRLHVRTSATAPMPPSVVDAQVVNTTLRVTWSPPVRFNGNISDVVYDISLWRKRFGGTFDIAVDQHIVPALHTTEAVFDTDNGYYMVIITAINNAVNLSSPSVHIHADIRHSGLFAVTASTWTPGWIVALLGGCISLGLLFIVLIILCLQERRMHKKDRAFLNTSTSLDRFYLRNYK